MTPSIRRGLFLLKFSYQPIEGQSMSLRKIDGAKSYSTANINQKWSASLNASVLPTSGAFGGQCLQLADIASAFLLQTFDNQSTWIVGFRINISGLPQTNTPIIQVLDSGNAQVELRINADGTLSITRNGTALSSGQSTATLRLGIWQYVEFQVTIASSISAHTCRAYIDNNLIIDVAAGQDTQNTANNTANSIKIAGSTANTLFEDFYFCDGQGTINNTVLGSQRIFNIMPNSAGDSTQFTVVGSGNNWSAVNEIPPNNDGTYVYSQTPGQVDLYNLQDLTISSGTITGIQTNLFVRKDDVGARALAAMIKTGGTAYQGASFLPAINYLYFNEIHELNPNTAVAWTISDINALQAGVKLVS